VDRGVVDGGVNGAGWLTRRISSASMWWDKWIIDGAVWLSATGALLVGFVSRLAQTGRVQAYAFVFLAGVAVLLAWRWF
jgi:hypothetical protein